MNEKYYSESGLIGSFLFLFQTSISSGDGLDIPVLSLRTVISLSPLVCDGLRSNVASGEIPGDASLGRWPSTCASGDVTVAEWRSGDGDWLLLLGGMP